jgi:predicted ribosome quality control (RQC) complex YloA/Tae2 family protein
MIKHTISFSQLEGSSVDYFIGKSAKDNFDIIDNAESHHIWFHIEGEPSGHVIASIPKGIDRKNVKYIIKQGAVLCKQYSKFKSEKKVGIVYTTVDKLQKADRIGSVVAEGTKTVVI